MSCSFARARAGRRGALSVILAAAHRAFSNAAPRRPLSLSLSLQFGGEHHNYQKTSLW